MIQHKHLPQAQQTYDPSNSSIINQHDYHAVTQSKGCGIHDHDTYTDSYSARQQQIRLGPIFSQQLQSEEQKHLVEHIKQIEKRSLD